MAVKVDKYQIRAGGKTYFPGDVISNLTKKEEKRLVDQGYCSVVDANDNPVPSPDANQNTSNDGDGPNTSHPIV